MEDIKTDPFDEENAATSSSTNKRQRCASPSSGEQETCEEATFVVAKEFEGNQHTLLESEHSCDCCSFFQSKYYDGRDYCLKYHCFRCYDILYTYKVFETHLFNRHKCPRPINEIDLYRDSMAQQAVPCHRCLLCKKGQYFMDLHSLQKHVNIDHQLCNVCGTKLKSNIEEHIAKHKSEFKHLFQCMECQFDSPFEQKILDHMVKQHKGGIYFLKKSDRRQFDCPYCHYSSNCKRVLELHMEYHKCKTCEVCFTKYIPSAKHIACYLRDLCRKCESKSVLRNSECIDVKNIKVDPDSKNSNDIDDPNLTSTLDIKDEVSDELNSELEVKTEPLEIPDRQFVVVDNNSVAQNREISTVVDSPQFKSDDHIDTSELCYTSSIADHYRIIKFLEDHSTDDAEFKRKYKHIVDIIKKIFVDRKIKLEANVKLVYSDLVSYLVENNQPLDQPVQCFRCGLYLVSILELHYHLMVSHKIMLNNHSLLCDLQLVRCSMITDYRCLLCKSSDDEYVLSDLLNHVKSVHNYCCMCGNSCIDHLTNHETDIMRPNYFCHICKRNLIVDLETYMKHFKSHPPYILSLANKFQCPYCQFMSDSEHMLSYHLQYHKVRDCVKCSERFVTNTKHVTGAGEKTKLCYKCNDIKFISIAKYPNYDEKMSILVLVKDTKTYCFDVE